MAEAAPSLSACPGCAAAPLAEAAAKAGHHDDRQFAFSVPTIHCAACISTLERGLMAREDVTEARVNLSLKRVYVTAHGNEDLGDRLQDAIIGLGYDALPLDTDQTGASAHDRIGRGLLMRLAVAGFAAMNVMLLSVSVWSGATDATRDFLHWVSAAITLPTIAFTAQPFFRSAMGALRRARLNMDVPISLAILLACAMSLYETMQGGEHAYFDAALSLTFFLLLGRTLDHMTRGRARSAAAELSALEAPRAHRIEDGRTRLVPVADLAIGDLVTVLPGMRMPVDGEITDGTSEIDRAIMTGESAPAAIAPGDTVHAGEMNLTGPLTLRVSARSEDTSLHRLAELVARAETARTNATTLADKAAAIYAPGVHLIAAITFAGWLIYSGDVRLSLNIAIAVLIITCPCALGLAVPAVMTSASGKLYAAGILLKNGAALERLAEVDRVAFDKTGTLTMGTPTLTNADAIAPETLSMAAALASGSAHPLSQAIVTAARARNLPAAPVSDRREHPGHGVSAMLDGQTLRLGRADWLGAEATDALSTWLRIGNADPIPFTFTDTTRPDAVEAISTLAPLHPAMLTGDVPASAQTTAKALGIKNVHAGITPHEKAALITAEAESGHKVLMVGDGLNDTAALASAHVSMAPAAALDAARAAADFVLMGQSLKQVTTAHSIARQARRRILENFAIAAAYNAVAIPLSVMGYATPLMAALAMSTSSICVSLNAMRLKG